MPVGPKMVVVFKARVEHCVSLGLSHAIKFAFVVVPQTDVFHCSSPHSSMGGAGSTAVADFPVTVSSNEARQILI
jgi:hypothetical protein